MTDKANYIHPHLEIKLFIGEYAVASAIDPVLWGKTMYAIKVLHDAEEEKIERDFCAPEGESDDKI